MATNIYLGLPPPNVIKWIQENYKEPWSEKTLITFSDGTSWEGLIEGAMDCPALVTSGLMPEGSGTQMEPSWIKPPKEVIIGNKVTSIGEHAFY